MVLRNVKIAILIIIGIAIAIPLIHQRIFHTTFLETITFAQAIFSALALVFIIYTFNVSVIQLNKAMARPKLSLAFSEDGKTETSIDISKTQSMFTPTMPLWVLNKGNAVAELFQIELEMPKIYNPTFSNFARQPELVLYSTGSQPSLTDENAVVISIFNRKQIPCFVNSPVQLTSYIFLKMYRQNYNEFKDFKIKYRIFGDWTEAREGELKVICKK